MTWSKYGTEFNDECANADLSDAAYRTHREAIDWIYLVERFDCRVPKQRMRRIATTPEWELAVKELLEKNFWREEDETYYVMHHRDVIRQSLMSQQQKRYRDRSAQIRRRNRQAGKDPDVSGGVSADVSADPAATQSDSQTDRQTALEQGEVATWPPVAEIKP